MNADRTATHRATAETERSPAPFDVVIGELRRRPRSEWIDRARNDQSHRWRYGQGVNAEDYLQHLPELRDNVEESLVIIAGEIVLRQEIGPPPHLDEYRQRFPEFGDRLAIQFEVNRLLESIEESADDWAWEDHSPVQLPGYEFLEQLGAGAAGVVYKARQLSLGRLVAVKVVRASRDDFRQLWRQRKEAEILGRLNHSNVVHIHEVREYGDCLFLVMELVSGRTLADRIGGCPIGADEASRIALALAEGVDAVHRMGVLHRDLKPSNILLTEAGELKISDFGLARVQASRQTLTADSILGTPSYMSPEQASGAHEDVGPASDAYSIGAILYEMLTGRPAFLGSTILDTLALIRDSEPVPPRRLVPGLPRDLETICLTCLEKASRQRYESTAALAEDLRRFRNGVPILARRAGPLRRTAMWLRRRPSTAAAVAILLFAMLVGGLAWRAAAARYQRRIDSALIDSIASADLRALPTMLGSLSARGDDPNIRHLILASLAKLHPPEPRWVNLSLAASALGPGPAGDSLLDYLPRARPGELSLLISRLAEQQGPLHERAWEKLGAPEISGRDKLNLACLVARTAPDDLRWSGIARPVAAALIEVHPIDVGVYTNMLMPARKQLVASLADAYRQRVPNDPLRREVVAGLLSRLGAEEPARLADLLVEADVHEFSLFVDAVQSQKELAKPPLHRAAATRTVFAALAANQPWGTRHAVVQTYDASERRRATAMIALWRLGERDTALNALRDGSEPGLESWLVELLAPLGVAAGELVDEILAAEGAGLRKSLLLALGNLDLEGLPGARRLQISEAVLRLYDDDPDPGVHSACELLLAKRLNVDPPSSDAGRDEKPSGPRRWFNGPNDHTFAVLDPADYTMGAPLDEMTREEDETPHLVRIGHSYAIATKETSVEQFLRCRDDYFNRRYSASDDCPANNISWYDAAAYCRWLSELEGVPENQMCFPPRDEIGPGMKLPEDWIARTGYRLPTESEWEYACRGGTTTSRYCGEGKALLHRYAWFVENSDDHAWPVGRLLPNRFGLFDMMGNVTERCFDEYGAYPARADQDAAAPRGVGAPVNGASLRVFRGGNFGDTEHNLRSARRYANAATDEWALVGFRIARTMPSGDR